MIVPSPSRILVVDDDTALRRLVRAVFQPAYHVEEAATGQEALRILSEASFDLVLLDIVMPGIDGYETCRRIKSMPEGKDVQVIMVSAKTSRQEQTRAYEAGADDYVVKPFDTYDLRSRVSLHLQLRSATACANAIRAEIECRSLELRSVAEQRKNELLATQDVAVFTLAKLAESRDQEAAGHLTRIRTYAQLLAEELSQHGRYAAQIHDHFLEDLYRSAPLHDIGKVGIRDEILLKPSRLTAEEFAAMQQHTVIGANILDEAVAKSQGGGFLAMAALIARFHHERFDGSGYPAGLVAEEIPLPARIVAVADVYDALTSVRPYKPAYSPAHARELIDQERGRHFDPVIVTAFQQRFADILAVQREAANDLPVVQGAMAFREYEELLAAAQRADGEFSSDPLL